MRPGDRSAAACEVALPSLCPSCHDPLDGREHGLCGACWSATIPWSGPSCPRCGGPSDSADERCLACVDDPPPQSATVVWGEYDGVLRSAILALKHRGRDELAAALGRRLAARVELQPWAAEIEVVTAVPSHPVHRLSRGWTAAELLARAVAQELGRDFDRLLRRRGRARQAGQRRAQRLKLPHWAFAPRPAAVRGRRVLLIDDVTTTGTTLGRAAEALALAGAPAVFCAVLASAPDGRRLM